MEEIIGKLLQDFEQGKMNRRQLVRSLAVAASVASVGSLPAAAADGEALKVSGINHVSYQVADYAKTRDFYANVLGMKVTADTGKQATLAFGNATLIVRPGTGTVPFVDHIAYNIDNSNQEAVLAELKKHGLNPGPEGQNSFQVKDPNNYHVQLDLAKK